MHRSHPLTNTFTAIQNTLWMCAYPDFKPESRVRPLVYPDLGLPTQARPLPHPSARLHSRLLYPSEGPPPTYSPYLGVPFP